MTESAFFQDLAMMMTIAGTVAVIFARFGWPKVIGYILAGVLMNDYTWAGSFLADENSIKTFGQLGVVFLMFGMGLSFSAKEMGKIRNVVLPAAILDTVVMIWLGYTVGTRLFGWSAPQALFLGVAICDSATTLLAKVIDEMGWGNRAFSKYVLGTSVCEDIVCVGAIAVATGCAKGQGLSFTAFAGSLGGLCVFFLCVLVFGFIIVPRLLQSVAKKKDDESLTLAMLGCCFLVSYFAYRYDYSLALGAFLVGVLGSGSVTRDKLVALAEPLKTTFAAIFFVTIGLLVDPAALWSQLPSILLVSAVVIGGKFTNCLFASLASGLPLKASVQIACSLAQIGEFAFMVAILYANIVGGAENAMFTIAVGASLLTTLLNPFLIRASDKIGDWAEKHCPARVNRFLETYHGWLDKIKSAPDSFTVKLLKAALIRLALYGVLVLAVFAVCSQLSHFDFSRFSVFFEQHDNILFFILANVFAVAMLPLVTSAARALGDEVAQLIVGDGNAPWQQPARVLGKFVVSVAVFIAFFAEWTMLNVAFAPARGGTVWIAVAIVALTGILGWRFFTKAGHRATTRFFEALSAEERRAMMAQTTAVVLPENVHRLVLDTDSPAIGATVVTLNVRAKTGTTIVSVVRDGKTTRGIGPEWEFAIGDEVYAIGTSSQIAALKDLLGVMH